MNDFDPTASALWPTWVALYTEIFSGRRRRKRRRGRRGGGQMKVTAIEVNLDLKSPVAVGMNPTRPDMALIFHI